MKKVVHLELLCLALVIVFHHLALADLGGVGRILKDLIHAVAFNYRKDYQVNSKDDVLEQSDKQLVNGGPLNREESHCADANNHQVHGAEPSDPPDCFHGFLELLGLSPASLKHIEHVEARVVEFRDLMMVTQGGQQHHPCCELVLFVPLSEVCIRELRVLLAHLSVSDLDSVATLLDDFADLRGALLVEHTNEPDKESDVDCQHDHKYECCQHKVHKPAWSQEQGQQALCQRAQGLKWGYKRDDRHDR